MEKAADGRSAKEDSRQDMMDLEKCHRIVLQDDYDELSIWSDVCTRLSFTAETQREVTTQMDECSPTKHGPSS